MRGTAAKLLLAAALAAAALPGRAQQVQAPPNFGPNTPVLKVTHQTYEAEVLRSTIPVIVDYYEDWCWACRYKIPALEYIAVRWRSRLKVVRVNAAEEPEMINKLNPGTFPAIYYVMNGRAWRIDIEVVTDNSGATVGYRFVPHKS